MRAKCERGINVVLKQQESLKNPVIMSVEDYNDKTGVATCVGFTTQNAPFRIEVHTDNLEKANLKRYDAYNK